ncbi:MAG: GDSL-type esterase/lipase family protein, partial [Stackebrandtia sp.]
MRTTRGIVILVSLLTLVGLLTTPAAAAPGSAGPRWVGSWAMAVQKPIDGIFEPNWAVAGFANQTVRQVARISVGGSVLRIHLSNVYGSAPLRVAGATVAKAGDGASIRPGTLRPVTAGHRLSFTVPAGRELVSDPVLLSTAALDRVAVTLYFAEPTGPVTNHALASATSYRAAGDRRFARDGSVFTETTHSYYYLSEVDVTGFASRGTVVAFGDSITDGAFSTNDTNNRYPDELAERLVAARIPFGVSNAGIGGNRVLDDSDCFGEAPATRFARDVLDTPGVRSVIVLEATNDLISVAQTEPGPCGPGHPDLTV